MDVIITALKALFVSAIKNASPSLHFHDIKSVFYGKPETINASSLPAITISPIETLYAINGTKLSKKIYTIDAVIVFNASDYVKESPTDAKKSYAVEAGIQMAEKMDADHGNIQSSIVGVIYNNHRLPYTDSAGVARNACDFCSVE